MVRSANYLSIKRPTYQAGTILCAASPTFPLAGLGEVWTIGEAGFIGGVSGLAVVVSDFIVALVDTPAGDYATVGSNWNLTQPDLDMSDLQVTGSTNVTDLYVSGSTKLSGGVIFLQTMSGNTVYGDTVKAYSKIQADNPNGVVATPKISSNALGGDVDLTLMCGAQTDRSIRFQQYNGSSFVDVAHTNSSGFVVDGQFHMSTGTVTVGGNTGWTGTFQSSDGSTVTVTQGIITDVS